MPALQSGCYELTWEKCPDLPSPMCHASAVLHNEKVYVMAGLAPDNDIYRYVFTYDVSSNHWDRLPPPGHAFGVLQIINRKLSVIGGADNATVTEATNKVSTFINNSWIQHYPHMSQPRFRPGVATYSDYVIVAGGRRDANTYNDDIELLYYKQSPHWIRTNINLPEPMAVISLTISDDLLYIAGYDTLDVLSNKGYKVAVDKITSSVAQPSTSSQTVQWTTIPSTRHYHTAIIPNSCPPVIIGGDDGHGVSTADVAMLKHAQSWSKVASLSSPRLDVAVVPINCESILVIGGSTGCTTLKEAMAHSISTVEKGTVKQSHTVAAISKQQCIIQ